MEKETIIYNFYVERDDCQYPPEYFETYEEAQEYADELNRCWLNHREYVYDAKTHERVKENPAKSKKQINDVETFSWD